MDATLMSMMTPANLQFFKEKLLEKSRNKKKVFKMRRKEKSTILSETMKYMFKVFRRSLRRKAFYVQIFI